MYLETGINDHMHGKYNVKANLFSWCVIAKYTKDVGDVLGVMAALCVTKGLHQSWA